MAYSLTPAKVVALITEKINGKTVCDLGCGTGNFMEAMKDAGATVKGIEQTTQLATIAGDQGLDVENRNFLAGDLPEADVYYIYQDDRVLGEFVDKVLADDIKSTFIVAITGSTLAQLAMQQLGATKIVGCAGHFILYIWET